MSDFTRVFLITGFLGSGKTTFLNRVIGNFPSDMKLTVLVNEFGEIGIDGTLVEGDDIDMMEISRGSIFCVCVKTDFIKGLYELNSVIRPDVLIIESSGVANPAELKRDLNLPIFNDRFVFAEQFCIVDAVHFLDAYGVYASIEKQIASSGVFIINKVDMAEPEKIADIKRVIADFHPDPLFFETNYAGIPLENFFDFIQKDSEGTSLPKESAPLLSSAELESFIDNLFENPSAEMTPPDLLVSAAYRCADDCLEEIEAVAAELPSSIVRGKGFVRSRGVIYLFNYVMGDWSIEEAKLEQDKIGHKNVVVFIGSPDFPDKLDKIVADYKWINIGILQPFSEE